MKYTLPNVFQKMAFRARRKSPGIEHRKRPHIDVKRPFTLMEVLIAMVLTMLILTTLTFFYQQVVLVGVEIDRAKQHEFYMRYVENRLAYALPKALSAKKKEFAFFTLNDEGVTKSGSPSLIFTFDNGASLDKLLSNHVIARLYVDPEGRLTLAYWPTKKNWDKPELPPMKKEVLLEQVEAMEFAFYIAPEPSAEKEKNELAKPEEKPAATAAAGDQKKPPSPAPDKASQDEKNQSEKTKGEEQQQSPEPKGDWRLQPWLKEFKQLPIIIKITLKMEGNDVKMVFMFPLANAKEHVVYE